MAEQPISQKESDCGVFYPQTSQGEQWLGDIDTHFDSLSGTPERTVLTLTPVDWQTTNGVKKITIEQQTVAHRVVLRPSIQTAGRSIVDQAASVLSDQGVILKEGALQNLKKRGQVIVSDPALLEDVEQDPQPDSTQEIDSSSFDYISPVLSPEDELSDEQRAQVAQWRKDILCLTVDSQETTLRTAQELYCRGMQMYLKLNKGYEHLRVRNVNRVKQEMIQFLGERVQRLNRRRLRGREPHEIQVFDKYITAYVMERQTFPPSMTYYRVEHYDDPNKLDFPKFEETIHIPETSAPAATPGGHTPIEIQRPEQQAPYIEPLSSIQPNEMPEPVPEPDYPMQTSEEVTADIRTMAANIQNREYARAIIGTLELPGITRDQLALLRTITMELQNPDSQHELWIAELNRRIRIPLISVKAE